MMKKQFGFFVRMLLLGSMIFSGTGGMSFAQDQAAGKTAPGKSQAAQPDKAVAAGQTAGTKQASDAAASPKTSGISEVPTPGNISSSDAAGASAFIPAKEGGGASGRGNVEDYVLQSGDRVKITIYPEDEYIKGGEMQVSTEGKIALPLVGKIDVGGKKVKEAEAAIRQIIDADYLVNPEVVIEVLKQSELSQIAVVVLGAVKKPGSYQFPVGEVKMTLLRAISEAGGFSDVANIGKIKIVRQEEGKKAVVKANAESIIGGDEPDVELKTGDIIHVAESLF